MSTTETRHRSSALLGHLARLTRQRSESALAPLGLRLRHLMALMVLRDGTPTQQALAAALSIDRTNLIGLLNELERAGLVVRRRSEEDRRRHFVELTEQGRQRMADADAALAGVEDEVLAGLDPDQREMLFQLLTQATSSHTLDCAAAAAEELSPESC